MKMVISDAIRGRSRQDKNPTTDPAKVHKGEPSGPSATEDTSRVLKKALT